MNQPKKRGAQARNKNAYKQGFYSLNIPADIEWELLNSYTDSLKPEIDPIRILMFRLATAKEKPDPDLKDPDAPYNMLLLATHRLDIIHTINAELQDPLPVIAKMNRDFHSHSQHASDLYTIQNLEKAASLMLGKGYIPLEKYSPPELLEKYEYILARQKLFSADDLDDEE